MDLRGFVDLLRREGELAVVDAEVDPYLEITEIADRASKARGPALLFSNVTGSGLPVLVNQFGSERRVELAFGSPLEAVARRIADLGELRASGGSVAVTVPGDGLSAFAPFRAQEARAQAIDPPDLSILPALTSWPGDGGPFITLPVVVTKDRDGRRNAGLYRLQVFDAVTTGMHWHLDHDGAANYRDADGRLPVAVAIGTDPVVTYAATAPLPAGVDEFAFAGFLRGAPIELARCQTVDLETPADAEIVLEGYVERGDVRDEGPCGNHTGYYSEVAPYPVFHVTCMRMRHDAIYPATIVGRPPMEDCYLGTATAKLFLPLLRHRLPEIVDLALPLEGVFNRCAIVSVRKSHAGHARTLMNGLWGMKQWMLTKFIVVVDEDVDVHDAREVAWRMCDNVSPERDCIISYGPIDSLERASSRPRIGAHMGVDATRAWPEEGQSRGWPVAVAMDPAVVSRVTERWAEFDLPFPGSGVARR
jgi:4-hydroxy-3-polyprenylbenzoate decarboxylase